MPGVLYVVATPIGNLEDVTLRALRILREVSLIAAEDTRRTAKLLQHYSISTPTTSLHEHNEHRRTPELIQRLQSGASIAVVSDAGTPGISDPGARLVAAAHAASIAVHPVPGANAAAALVSASGLGANGFVFVGFPPSRSFHRKRWLRELVGHRLPVVVYEAPHRIEGTLADIASEMGPRMVGVGRELTKMHEELAIRPISAWLKNPPTAVGEFALIIAPAEAALGAQDRAVSAEILAEEFGQITDKTCVDRREALRTVARRYGVRVRDVFAAVEAHKNSVE